MRALLSALVLSSFLTIPLPSVACSLIGCVGDGVELRQDFTVNVTHQGRPLTGVAVLITRYGGEENGVKSFSGITGSDGTVRIADLPPGVYWLKATFLEIDAGSECFHVSARASRKAKRTLAYEWGNLAPSTRRIAGKLIDSQPGQGGPPIWNLLHRVNVPIREARLELRNPLTAEVYRTQSDADGHFSFDQEPIGTYVLHIDAGTAPNQRDFESTDLLVHLAADAKADGLVLERREAGGTSCGGTYLELLTTPN